MQQHTDEQWCFDIGIILYSKNKDFGFEKQITDLMDSLREYSNEFVLHPKHIRNLEIDSVFPQINICYQGEDDKYTIDRIEDFNYAQLNVISEGKLVSTCSELSDILQKRFRQRCYTDWVSWVARGQLLVLTDGSFLDVVSVIEELNSFRSEIEGIKFRSDCVVVGLSDNYWCCYEYDAINRIHHMSQIADVLLFHHCFKDYRFPVADIFDETTVDLASIDDEDWF